MGIRFSAGRVISCSEDRLFRSLEKISKKWNEMYGANAQAIRKMKMEKAEE